MGGIFNSHVIDTSPTPAATEDHHPFSVPEAGDLETWSAEIRRRLKQDPGFRQYLAILVRQHVEVRYLGPYAENAKAFVQHFKRERPD